MSDLVLGAPALIDGWPYMPAWWLGAISPWCKNPKHPSHLLPRLLVVHCGDVHANLAEYMLDPVDKAPPAPAHPGVLILCHDGKWRRRVATHAAWHQGQGRLVQMLPMTLEGWGTGDAQWNGMSAQRIAWHVELPGPPTLQRDGRQLTDLQDFARECKARGGTHWVGHQNIDPEKHDPGPNLPDDWADGILEDGRGL